MNAHQLQNGTMLRAKKIFDYLINKIILPSNPVIHSRSLVAILTYILIDQLINCTDA